MLNARSKKISVANLFLCLWLCMTDPQSAAEPAIGESCWEGNTGIAGRRKTHRQFGAVGGTMTTASDVFRFGWSRGQKWNWSSVHHKFRNKIELKPAHSDRPSLGYGHLGQTRWAANCRRFCSRIDWRLRKPKREAADARCVPCPSLGMVHNLPCQWRSFIQGNNYIFKINIRQKKQTEKEWIL